MLIPTAGSIAGATKIGFQMAKSNTQAAKPAVKQAAKPVSKPAGAIANMAATVAAAPAPAPVKAVTVALRGGAAVQAIKLSGTAYRTGAAHNASWWKTLQEKLADGVQPVAPLIGDGSNGTVPAHFIGYALRRGYLQQAELK